MPNLTILSKEIRKVGNLYSINDLHKASGEEDKHKPANFMRNDQTQSLIKEIQCSDLSIETKTTAYKVNNGGKNPGTYVCKELVYAYAMWISAKFHLLVIRAFDAMQSEPKPTRKTKPKALPNGLTLDQQDAIKSLVKSRVAELPQDKQGGAAIKLWSSLKSKFGCTYKEIEPENFTEAVSLVSRLPLEGEYIPAERMKSYRKMSSKQARELTNEIHRAFVGWCFNGGSENQALYNRIRAENNISRFEDLPVERIESVKALINQVEKMNSEFISLFRELKRHYLNNYVGAGAPWTPDLKRKWQKKFDEQLPTRPNWLDVQRKLTAH